jgi:hypothetical protein
MTTLKTILDRPVSHLARHYLEMLIAMFVGMLEADRHLGRDAGVPAVRLGTTGSVASAPCAALRAAAVASMSAIGFMEPSVALVCININHELEISIR